MLGREGADQFAVFEFQFPAEGLSAFEVEIEIEIHFGAGLLHIHGGAGFAVPADAKAGEFAVFLADFDGLLFLALGAGFVGGVGDTGPAARDVGVGGLRGESRDEEGAQGE